MRLSALVIAGSVVYSATATSALNLNFVKNTKSVPAVLTDDVAYPAGSYVVDVIVNNESTGRSDLLISKQEESGRSLCFTQKWLREADVNLNLDKYSDVFDRKENCFNLTKDKHTRVNFDYAEQKLIFHIPQAYLVDKRDPSHWDYGVNAGRITYQGNFNKTGGDSVDAFGNVDVGLNIGRWVLSSNFNTTRFDNKTELSSSDLTLYTALSALQGNFILGKSQTRSELFDDFGFYGVALRSNASMRPQAARGYAPEITGIATSQSRITVKQNGYIVYSKVVPAGPYKLDDLQASGNGDMEVIVEDENGHKSSRFYPVTTLPTLLRAGEFKYNLASGKKNRDNKLNNAFSSDAGIFVMGSLDYGFPDVTVNTATILNDRYQAFGVGATKPLGEIGAVSGGATFSKARYANGNERKGQSFSVKYAKSFAARTELQLLAYQYRSKGYVEFANYRTDDNLRDRDLYDRRRSRYEARLSRQLDNAYLSASYWQQNYWGRSDRDAGATLSVGTTVMNSISLFLNGNYTKQANASNTGRDDYSVSLGVNIPFTLKGENYYSSSSADYSRNGGSSFSTGISSISGTRLNYGANANSSSRGYNVLTANAGYAFNAVQTNVSLSQSHQRHGKSQTSIAGGVSGSVFGTTESGILFTKETTGTVGIVSLPGVEGVSFSGSAPTNKDGNTAVSLSEYQENDISINMNNVPDNLDLEKTSFKVVPTENAVIYRRFGFKNVLRYILRIRNKDGHYLNGGEARTEQGIYAGFVASNGVLLMDLLAKPESVRISLDDGSLCRVSTGALNANTNKVQEVTCE